LASGCIHWSWQEGQCKFHYANSRRARSPSLGSPYEYTPELATLSSVTSSSSGSIGSGSGSGSLRRSTGSDSSGFDIKKIVAESAETTFTMIKPDAAQYPNVVQAIATRFIKEGFTIMEYRKIGLSAKVATELYSVHKDKVWFSELLAYVTGGSCVIFALRKEGAVQGLRTLVGPTDPDTARKSEPDTLRALYGSSKQSNAVHCSDSLENATRELDIFFPCNLFNVDSSSSSSSSSSDTSSTTSETTTST